MSAGICIMNKNAIALAADSAVTIGQHLAIHNSANKLFALSKVAPVGVIIYSNADFMNIPMEIMIKQFKMKLGKTTYATLKDYVDQFLSFLLENENLFRFTLNESSFVSNIYRDLLCGLRGDYEILLKRAIKEAKRDLTTEEVSIIQNEAINDTIGFVNSYPDIPGYDVIEYIREKYGTDIEAFLHTQYNWVPQARMHELCEAIYLSYNKIFFRSGYVGLAFAGYGDENIFPQMIHLHLSGIINHKIRYSELEHVEITEDNTATIIPLAQVDVMQTFLFGINKNFVGDIGRELPAQINQCLVGLDDSYFAPGKKVEVQAALDKTTKSIIGQIIDKAQQQYLFPITQSVASLPIEELSLLAESMINITSLRRRVAIDNNIGTVGGPIDVAIISKNDGFIWLKRKHYFNGSYNPQYFYTHYPYIEVKNDEKTL